MSTYLAAQEELRAHPRSWLVTGVAGFIGSHLLERLLLLGQKVTGLDNFATGHPANLAEVRRRVDPSAWAGFRLVEGSVADPAASREAIRGVEIVLHQAGFVSVPLSFEEPLKCHETNVTGTLQLLTAARAVGARRFVYASSSAVYGEVGSVPNVEEVTGRPLSPYGASKAMAEVYAELASTHFDVECAGLRYFNVFGPRQDPTGGYAAVIPQWLAAHARGEPCRIHGDGGTTRDFCHVANVVQANLLAATAPAAALRERVFNVALGGSTTLNELHRLIVGAGGPPPQYRPARTGDIRHSSASIQRIQRALGFTPGVAVAQGLQETAAWYRHALAE